MAYWYPADPREDLQTQCEKFIKALPAMIPCGNCANDFINFQLRGSDPPEQPGQFYPNGVFPEGGLIKNACKSQSNLFEFFVQAHNNVSRHVHPNRTPFTVAMAKVRHEAQDVPPQRHLEGERGEGALPLQAGHRVHELLHVGRSCRFL